RYNYAVSNAINEDLLLKTVRIEAHLGRELSRMVNLLRALQADRKVKNEEDID
nr:hypothetical protein [Acidimicrobiia bacterium]